MEENKSITHYVSQIFATYGITVALFLLLGTMVGESVRASSSLFSLGREGYSLETLGQLFLLSIMITLIQIIFLTDRWIKKMSLLLRNICFFLVVILVIVLFSTVFAWFSIKEVGAWIGFFISFFVCMVISISISRLEEKAENKKMEQALENFKQTSEK